MRAIWHRIDQGIRALLAFAQAPELELGRQYLSPCELAAFKLLSRADQLHSIRVLRRVLKANRDPPRILAAAALLHDVGKSRYHLSVWQKTAAVLATTVAPSLSRRLSSDGQINRWRAPFSVQAHHAAWGGQILRLCDSEAALIWLVEHHQTDAAALTDEPLFKLLTQLQDADNAR